MKKINWQYAIGEIVIVIIGITIAFGLNNWAEGRKDKALEKRYLENLILDLEIDAAVLEENVEKIGQDLNILGALMPHLKANLPRRDTMVRKFFKLAEPVDFIPNNITYQTLINSGDFKVIADFEFEWILLYGAFLFISIFAYTSLMDYSNLAIPFELVKLILGGTIMYGLGSWYGLEGLMPWGTIFIMLYLIISFGFTILFKYNGQPQLKLS